METKLNDLVGRCAGVAILLGDLDRFKEINDTLGHPVGDALLKHVGGVLRSIVKDGDMPVRLGGDEFAIVAAGPDSSDRLKQYSARLIHTLSGPQNVDGRLLQTGISIGIASGPPPSGKSAELIQMADLALYEAKKAGRGRSAQFHAELQRSAHRRKWLEDNLRLALATEGQLAPVFQAQTDLRTRQIVGFEALARWTHPDEGPISPCEFIPAAEDAGLIQQLTATDELCSGQATWRTCQGQPRPVRMMRDRAKAVSSMRCQIPVMVRNRRRVSGKRNIEARGSLCFSRVALRHAVRRVRP